MTESVRCSWRARDGEQCSWPNHLGNVHHLKNAGQTVGRLADDHIPRWCFFSPILRGFVMANALAAPMLIIAWALAGHH